MWLLVYEKPEVLQRADQEAHCLAGCHLLLMETFCRHKYAADVLYLPDPEPHELDCQVDVCTGGKARSGPTHAGLSGIQDCTAVRWQVPFACSMEVSSSAQWWYPSGMVATEPQPAAVHSWRAGPRPAMAAKVLRRNCD